MAIVTPYIYIPATNNINKRKIDGTTPSYASYYGATGIYVDVANGVGWTSHSTGNFRKFNLSDLSILNTYSCQANNLGLCLDKDGNIWISGGTGANTVEKYDTGGSLIATVNVGTLPACLVADNDGYVYVSNFSSSNVSKIDISTNTVVDTFASGTNPYGICVDNSGNVITANTGSANISKINKSTGSKTDISVQTFPYYLAVDTNDICWVSNYTTGSISKVDLITSNVSNFVSSANPQNVFMDKDNNAWVIFPTLDKVSKYISDGSSTDYAVDTGAFGGGDNTGFIYQHFVLESDAPVPSTFVPRIIFM